MSDSEKTEYCPHCEETREVRKTVPWQSDFCAFCGHELEES